MREIGHFIGGKTVKGGSGRFGDVFDPNTGEVQAKVALAKHSEVEHAIANAQAAQPAWAATNPQRRARVMFKFLELVQKEFEPLAKLLSSEHGKTIPDARGDIQRGIEVVEFACGIPHLLKGEFTEGAGPSIDLYSVRQPLGVVAGITPFNFPAMIPMWKFAPAIACGNAFILKPSERDPSVPIRLAELMIDAGLPLACSTLSMATRKPSTRFSPTRASWPLASSGLRRSRSTSTQPAALTANASNVSAAQKTI